MTAPLGSSTLRMASRMAGDSALPAWAMARPRMAAASYERSAAGAPASNFENGGYSRAKYSVDGVLSVPDEVP